MTLSTHSQPGPGAISVKGHCPGMPVGFHEHLFDRCRWKGDNPTSIVAGIKLGLPMAPQLVEMQGLRIWFDTKAGEGSDFHFTLPASLKGKVR